MGLFHDTLRDAEKLFDKDKTRAIKILRKHQSDAHNLRTDIDISLLDYYEGLGGICLALEKNNIVQANLWLEGQVKSLKKIKKVLEKLKKALD